LYQYLEKPARVVPGTKMAFAGLAKGQDRADVIAYLSTAAK
jgi:cytochrome c